MRFYTISEAAKLLDLSPETLRRWDRNGKIRVGRTPSGNRIFSEEDIEAIKSGFQAGPPPQFSHGEETQQSLEQLPEQSYTTLNKVRLIDTIVPKLSSLKNLNFKILVMLLITFASLAVTFYTLFSFTPYPKQAALLASDSARQILGVKDFIAPALEESAPIGSLLGKVGGIFKGKSFVVPLLGKSELATDSNLRVQGNAQIAKDIEGLGNLNIKGTATVGKLITDIIDPYLIENEGSVQSTLEIKSVGDISLQPGSGNIELQGSLTGINNITATGNLGIGSLTLTGSINGNTLSSTKLVFSGSSPSIYPSTTNTSISLNASGTGAVNIGNSGTGDVYIAGGSSDTGCTITNSNGSLNCSNNITSQADIDVRGGDLTTNVTTFNLINTTATTLNIGGASTTISIGASTGTTTVNNALTVTGAASLSSTLSVTGTSTFTGNLTVNGRPTFTKAPTSAHTGTFTIDSSTWNVSDATIYVNPATATADSNLLGVAVGGGVKFAVDAEGDVFARNLVLTGNTTTGTTTVSGDLTVEGNTTLGDATTDTLTINPATITLAGGNKTLDLTGAATRTLTLLNSTVSQVADLDLSDGSLKIGGTTALDNSRNATLGTISGSTGTFSSAIAANGGITFDAATDTLGAHTLGGTLDASTQILTNIGNTGTDFVATTGALTLAGVLTANGGVTIAGGQNLALSSGTGTYTQTNAQTTDATADAHTITLSAGGTGATGVLRGLVVSQSDTGTTGVFDSLAYIANLKTPETTTNGLFIEQNAASGTLSNAIQITNTAGTLATGINFTGTFTNYIVATNFSVSNAGALVAVGVNSGSGLIQGTGGLTITGTVSLPNDSITAANISQGTAGQLLLSNATPDTAWTALSGDATLAGTGALTLANSGVTANTYGSTTAIPVITVDAKGRLTTVTTAAISSAWSSLTDPTANLSLTMAANTTTFTWNAATGASANLFNLVDTASNTGTGYLLNIATASLSNALPLRIAARGNTIIDTTATGGVTIGNATAAQAVTVDAGTATLNLGNSNNAKTINIGTGTSADTINIGSGGTTADTITIGGLAATTINITGTVNITGAIVGTSTIQGTQLISTVATGTAPLTVTSTTNVANLNASTLSGNTATTLLSQPQPNLVLNSDFSRRNKWMTFMPEVFTDTSGWTALVGSLGTVASNILTAGTSGANEWLVRAGLSTWRDARYSAQMKLVSDEGSATGVAKVTDANNYVLAYVEGGATDNLAIRKVIAGAVTTVATTAFAPTLNNWYWVELEAQGTTYIAKVYTSGASPVAKSSATLGATVTGTITDSAVTTGYIGLRSTFTNASQWGGLSTGDGGVYVEGWGPESFAAVFSGTKGGQAIGFDEAVDAGPIGKQWALRAYIPATSRGIALYRVGFGEFAPPSVSFTHSIYLKVSGKGGSGPLINAEVYMNDTAGANISPLNAYEIADAGETTWTRKNITATTTSGTRYVAPTLLFNLPADQSTTLSATGTAFVILEQLEQGSVATPWRNAPADDGPIIFRTAGPNSTITSTGTSWDETDSRDHAANVFCPFDCNLVIHFQSLWDQATAGKNNYLRINVDGALTNDTGAWTGFPTAGVNSQQISLTVNSRLAAGKHRVAVIWSMDAGGTRRIYADNSTNGVLTITANRGKYDLAEEYSVSDTTIGAGDVVRLAQLTTPNNQQTTTGESHLGGVTTIERTDKGYDSSILGIISTAPGITLSSTVELNSYQDKPNLRPVALSGRVPVKVTNENGPIKRGDILTSSNTLPGYAMKATRAGRSIGIAMDDFAPTESHLGGVTEVQTGKIMTFVNLSFYDPDVYLADTGEFIIRKSDNGLGLAASIVEGSGQTSTETETDTGSQNQNVIQLLPSIPKFTLFNNNTNETIERIGAYKDLFVANLKVGRLDVSELTLSGNNLVDLLGIRGSTSKEASASNSVSLTSTSSAQTLNDLNHLSGSILSRLDLLEKSVLSASISALLDLSHSNVLENTRTTEIPGTLIVLGKTTVNDLGITGKISSGLLTINGLASKGETLQSYATIDTLSDDLHLQSLGLGGINILNGKVTIDTSGNLTANKINISTLDAASASVGSAILTSGTTFIEITTSSVSPTSKIFVTPSTSTGKQSLSVSERSAGKFKVSVDEPYVNDIKFDWWVVN